jgi:hypothetical protein
MSSKNMTSKRYHHTSDAALYTGSTTENSPDESIPPQASYIFR